MLKFHSVMPFKTGIFKVTATSPCPLASLESTRCWWKTFSFRRFQKVTLGFVVALSATQRPHR